MSQKTREAGYIMRIGTMAFVLPIWALATGFFLWEGMYLYAAAMIFFGGLMGYGAYMNWKRISSDEKIDDERMKQINRKSGASAFWTMINTSAILMIFPELFTAALNIGVSTLHRYSLPAVVAIGFISYFAFRTYYLKYGLENEFWRFN